MEHPIDDAEDEDDVATEDASEVATHHVEAAVRHVKGELAKRGSDVPDDVLTEVLAPAFAGMAVEVSQTYVSSHSGPLPSAKAMKEYAELYPEAPAILFGHLQQEQKHRHHWESEAIRVPSAQMRRRDFLMFGTVAIGLAAAFYMIYERQVVWAAILIVVLILGGGALALGRQFLASHGKDGTSVQVSDEQRASE
ncbi:hypothetical protein [Pelagibacterium halotolerans]|uniref:hypothetical protein n=1 Tax=Pelagibacterium halotolerans TaxID=531813 RepID=UPI00384C8088